MCMHAIFMLIVNTFAVLCITLRLMTIVNETLGTKLSLELNINVKARNALRYLLCREYNAKAKCAIIFTYHNIMKRLQLDYKLLDRIRESLLN